MSSGIIIILVMSIVIVSIVVGAGIAITFVEDGRFARLLVIIGWSVFAVVQLQLFILFGVSVERIVLVLVGFEVVTIVIFNALLASLSLSLLSGDCIEFLFDWSCFAYCCVCLVWWVVVVLESVVLPLMMAV